MNELFRTLRLAFYVLALPLAVSAAVSAQSFLQFNQDVEPAASSIVEDLPPAPPKAVELDERHSFVTYRDADGGISGRLAQLSDARTAVATPGANVTLFRKGQLISQSTTDIDGVFRLENVPKGSYTFRAITEGALAAFGVYVVDDPSNVPPAGTIQLSPMAISRVHGSLDQVREVLNRDIPWMPPGSYEVDPMRDRLPVSNGGNRVALTSDGSLRGQIVALAWNQGTGDVIDMTAGVGHQVLIYRDGKLVGNGMVDRSGQYEVRNLTPGFYDLVAFGPYGVGCYCFEAIDGSLTSLPSTHSIAGIFASATGMLTTNSPQPGGGGDIVLTEPGGGAGDGTGDDDDGAIPPPPPPAPGFGPGGFGPGGFGGGPGGLGGIGNFGDLIGAGIGAWIFSELIDEIDDDNNVIPQPTIVPPVVVPPPASPAVI